MKKTIFTVFSMVLIFSASSLQAYEVQFSGDAYSVENLGVMQEATEADMALETTDIADLYAATYYSVPPAAAASPEPSYPVISKRPPKIMEYSLNFKWIYPQLDILNGYWWAWGFSGRKFLSPDGLYAGGTLVLGYYVNNSFYAIDGGISYGGIDVGKQFGTGKIKFLLGCMIGGGLVSYADTYEIWDNWYGWIWVTDYYSRGFFALEPKASLILHMGPSFGLGVSGSYLYAPIGNGIEVGGPSVEINLTF